MEKELHVYWKESFTCVSCIHRHIKLIPTKDRLRLRAQLEYLAMDYMNLVAELSSLNTSKEIRIKLAQAKVMTHQISSLLSMARIVFAIEDIKLQGQIQAIQKMILQLKSGLILPSQKISA